MFEEALLEKLNSDATLASYVSEFTISGSTVPAIFINFAPETAQLPYLVFRITRSSSECLAIKEFSVFLDYYDNSTSSIRSINAAERIELLLDRTVLESTSFNYIRLFYFSGSPIQEEDPRSIHYNIQFQARAGRKAWIDAITETTTTTTSGA